MSGGETVGTVKPKRDYVKDHARRTLRKAGLTDEQARKAVDNAAKCGGRVQLSAISRELPKDRSPASQWIQGAFLWDGSPEGFGYWDRLRDSLVAAGK